MAETDDPGGYGKPPKASQFKKGQSGNPGGKRKRPLTMAELLRHEMNRTIAIPVPGKKTCQFMTVGEIAVRRLAQKAADSDFRSIKLAMEIDRAEAAREELRAEKLAAEAEAAAIARGGLKPTTFRVTLNLEDDDTAERIFNNRVALKMAELGYAPDPRLGKLSRELIDPDPDAAEN